MDCQILLEKQPANGFVATVLGWPDCIGTGATKDEALTQVRAAVAQRLTQVEIVRLQKRDEVQAELRRIREEANRE